MYIIAATTYRDASADFSHAHVSARNSTFVPVVELAPLGDPFSLDVWRASSLLMVVTLYSAYIDQS